MTTTRVAILHWRDISNPEAGGAERLLFEVAKYLVSHGVEVVWFAPRFEGCRSEDTMSGVRMARLGGKISLRLLAPLYYIFKWHNQFDLFIDSITGVPWFTPVYVRKPIVAVIYHIGKRETFFADLPVHAGVAGFYLATAAWIAECLIRYVYRGTRFLTFSDDTREELHALGIPIQNITVSQEGIDLTRYTPRFEKPSIPVVVYVGRLVATKGVEHLLEAARILCSRISGLKVMILGRGYMKDELIRYSKRMGVSGIVEFPGFLDEQEKISVLRDAHVLVMPSLREGWATPVIEANACGTPAVGTNVPGVRSAIIDGQTGYLVPYGDPTRLADRILLLINTDQAREMSLKAYSFAQRYDIRKTIVTAAHAIISKLGPGGVNIISSGRDKMDFANTESCPVVDRCPQ